MQAAEGYRSRVAVNLILRRAGKVLFGKRFNTGFADGSFHFPSGHLEAGESVIEGVIREAREELGITIDAPALRCVHVMHRDYAVYFFFEADTWHGELVNQEPGLCSELVWLDPDDLPNNTVDYSVEVVKHCQQGTFFSLHGWAG